MPKFKMSPITPETPKFEDWKIAIGGKLVPAEMLSIINDTKQLALHFGQRPNGIIGLVIDEFGGGGSVTLPYSINPQKKLYVGLLQERRDNLNYEDYYFIMGGYRKPNESHKAAAERETQEESGIRTKHNPLPGLPGISNRDLFLAQPKNNLGVHKYSIETPWEYLSEDPERTGTYLIARSIIPHKEDAVLRFLKWQDAVLNTPDELARATIAQLLAVLDEIEI